MTERAMMERERVRAAVAREAVNRPPVSIWRHFPEQDQTAMDLAAATVAWQERFGFDFVKFMPPGDYPTIDWGATTEFRGAPGGTRETTRAAIAGVTDWASLRPVDVGGGFNGVVLDALRETRAQIVEDVPILQTIFSPLTIAQKLANGRAVEHLRAHPNELRAALGVIAEVTAAMARASYEAGADGIFFATQLADYAVLDETEYRVFGLPYDLSVLEAAKAAKPDGWTLLHLHGEAPMFDLGATYPVDVLNWHDRHAAPDLAGGQRLARRAVAGGLNELRIAVAGADAAAAEARDAIAVTHGRGLLVTPGCVVPVATPDETVAAVVAAVQGR